MCYKNTYTPRLQAYFSISVWLCFYSLLWPCWEFWFVCRVFGVVRAPGLDPPYLSPWAIPPVANHPALFVSIAPLDFFIFRVSAIEPYHRWLNTWPCLDKAPRLSISIVIWILSSDTICQLNQFNTNGEAAMLSSPVCFFCPYWFPDFYRIQVSSLSCLVSHKVRNTFANQVDFCKRFVKVVWYEFVEVVTCICQVVLCFYFPFWLLDFSCFRSLDIPGLNEWHCPCPFTKLLFFLFPFKTPF